MSKQPTIEKNNPTTATTPFSYARAASGNIIPQTSTTSPTLNGNSNQTAPSTPPNLTVKEPSANGFNEKATNAPLHSRKSSVSSSVSNQAAWTQKGAIHMPPRPNPGSSTPSSVTFGNFAGNVPTPVQEEIVASSDPAPVASGGKDAPSSLVHKDLPQFGSITPATSSAVSETPSQRSGAPLHNRTNSNTSDLRPPTMSPRNQYAHPQQGPYIQQPGMHNMMYGAYGQQFPPNVGYGRGMQRPHSGMNQYQQPHRGQQRTGPSPRNSHVPSPINTPQNQHAQLTMGSPMASPAMYQQYPQMSPQGQMYGGFYPGQNYDYNQQNMYGQQLHAQYMNQQPPRPPIGYPQNSYGSAPSLQVGASMSRSGSQVSERPPSGPSPHPQPTLSTAQPTPRKKGSSAIRIVNPNTHQELVVPKTHVAAETQTTSTPPADDHPPRPTSAAATRRPSTSVTVPTVETPEQKKAKQEAARQAVLARVAEQKAKEKSEQDAKDAEEKVKQDAIDAEEREKVEKEEKIRLEIEAAKAEKERKAEDEIRKLEEEKKKAQEEGERIAREAEQKRLSEEREAKEKADAEQKLRVEAEEGKEKARNAAAAAEKEAQDLEEKAALAEKEASEEAETTAKVAEIASEDETPRPSTAHELETIVESAGIGQIVDVVEEAKTDASEADDEKSMPPPSLEGLKRDRQRPLSLNLSKTINPEKPINSAPLTALRSSKFLTSLTEMEYPEGINSPDPSLNKNAPLGKYKYDKDFLLQFQKAYTDKPNFDWDERIRETIGESEGKSGSKGLGPRSASTRSSASPFSMGSFSTGKPPKTSEERFKASLPAVQMANSNASPFERGSNFKPSVSRQNSAVATPPSPRTVSKRGGRGAGRTESRREDKNQVGAPTIAPEDVKPLENSGNRWTPRAKAEPAPGLVADDSDHMAPDVVQRKVKGLLNKLTLDNFDRITDQILEIAKQSKDETDGRTLRQVIQLTFEKATDEAHFSNMYARFSRKMMECTDPSIKDDNVKDKQGQPVVGGTLFRKYLLSRCQEDFERGWKTELPPKPEGEAQSEEAAMLSDEYYIAAAAKRRGLGLVRFIGELFKLGMLNEKIMRECIRKLLANITDPEEEEVESLCQLVTTVGSALDLSEKSAREMNAYMDRMKQLQNAASLTSRIKFMVMDVIDLRAAGWVGKDTNKGPKTIQEIHDDAAKAEAEKAASRSAVRGGHGGGGGPRLEFGRGDARQNSQRRGDNFQGGNTTTSDGWTTLKQAKEPDKRAGDLGRFGTIRTKSMTPGPGGNLMGSMRAGSGQRSQNPSHSGNISREDSHTSQAAPANAFALLSGEPETHEEPDLPIGDPDTTGRPKLNLLPKGSTADTPIES